MNINLEKIVNHSSGDITKTPVHKIPHPEDRYISSPKRIKSLEIAYKKKRDEKVKAPLY